MSMSILEKLTLPDIRELIEDRDLETLREVLNRWNPVDLAALIEDLPADGDAVVFSVLDTAVAAQTFAYLNRTAQEELLHDLPEEQLAPILNAMSPDDRTALLEGLPDDEVERLLTLLTPAEQAIARSLLSYGVGTVGRLMTPDYIAVKEEWTIEQVLAHIRKVGKDSETLNAVFVTDQAGHLLDDIRMREILLAAPDAIVRTLMDQRVVTLSVTDEERQAVELFRKYDRTVLPVLDRRQVLVGIVTVDDVIDVAEEEATKEIQRFGGVEALEDPYFETPLLLMIRKRASWLVVLFLGELLTASAMTLFESEIAKAVVLAVFLPLIISSGGNCGSQAATLIVRALAVGEANLRDWVHVFRREIFAGLALGAILGILGFIRIAIWSELFPGVYGPHWQLIGVTVAFSLVGIVLLGTLAGSMLPFLLKRLGLDPATSSAPFVATLVDVAGLIIYFTLALLILRGTLL